MAYNDLAANYTTPPADSYGQTWLTAPCDESMVFSVPFEQRWNAAARLLGVDLSRISHLSGRA